MDFDIEWFEARLESTGQTQTDLAKFLGVDGSAITRTKKGLREWQVREVPLVAHRLECSVEELLERSGVESRPVNHTCTVREAKPSAPITIIGDGELLGQILSIIERVHMDAGIYMSTEQLGEMAAFEYESHIAIPSDIGDPPTRRARKLSRLGQRLKIWIRCNEARKANSSKPANTPKQ